MSLELYRPDGTVNGMKTIIAAAAIVSDVIGSLGLRASDGIDPHRDRV